jgi:hypothetical protein
VETQRNKKEKERRERTEERKTNRKKKNRPRGTVRGKGEWTVRVKEK